MSAIGTTYLLRTEGQKSRLPLFILRLGIKKNMITEYSKHFVYLESVKTFCVQNKVTLSLNM